MQTVKGSGRPADLHRLSEHSLLENVICKNISYATSYVGGAYLFACWAFCHDLVVNHWSADTFKHYLFQNILSGITGMSTSLDPDKARRSAGPILGPN